jgi:cysteine-rich repeat protein
MGLVGLALLSLVCAGCGEEDDPCEGVTCSGVGTCVVSGGVATCRCNAGYEPDGRYCRGICGDSQIMNDERCDDGNRSSGDGCSNRCLVEQGYSCENEPSVCRVVCGDGIALSPEECDDGNANDGDGCSSACVVEMGWTCTGEPSECQYPIRMYVDINSTASMPDGSSWSLAYQAIQPAINRAALLGQNLPSAIYEVWVADGTYPITSGTRIEMIASLSMYGGFRGNETDPSQRGDWQVTRSVLDGQGQAGPIVSVVDVDDVVLDGFFITNGNGNRGGGMLVDGAHIVVRNTAFIGNEAGDGGGIYITVGAVDAESVLFLDNRAAAGKGGGVFLYSGSFHATNSVFAENFAGWGGAFNGNIHTHETGYFYNCTIYDNVATYGRAIQSGYAYIYNSIIWGHGSSNPIYASVTGTNNVCEDDVCGDNSLDEDPRMSDPANRDFTLLPTSVCIDRAAPAHAPPTDFTGAGRYDDPPHMNTDGGYVDIGAFEYHP